MMVKTRAERMMFSLEFGSADGTGPALTPKITAKHGRFKDEL